MERCSNNLRFMPPLKSLARVSEGNEGINVSHNGEREKVEKTGERIEIIYYLIIKS